MKIFQIFENMCYWQTPYQSLKETEGKYASDIKFVEAPDYVFESWRFDETKKGDERFIKPTAPNGFMYDENTGTFYEIGYEKLAIIRQLKEHLADTDYKAIKYAEGLLLESEYAPIKAERQAWRDEINRLEKEIEIAKNKS